MILDRSAGVLLHWTSLPGPGGIGDLGPPAHRMLDWLARTGCRLWQFLPLTPVGRGWSPYQSRSCFAGNPLLISLERMAETGWLDPGDLEPTPPSDQVDFEDVQRRKMAAFAIATERWIARGRPGKDDFEQWGSENGAWLEDFALFTALRQAHSGRSWTQWDSPLRQRDRRALGAARERLAPSLELHKLQQYWFWLQWGEVRQAAAERGIRLIGDLPMYPDHDSADVWANPDLFKLDEAGEPAFLGGVPPDYFSTTGQLWEAPVYRWEAHDADRFRWWIRRLRHTLAAMDAVRIDHFRGLEAYWEVPAPAKTAESGHWEKAPGEALLRAIRNEIGSLPIIAEDLGFITPEVIELRDQFGLPGMRVLQLELEEATAAEDLADSYPEQGVAYTGTHDNDTSRGWFLGIDDTSRQVALRLLGGDGTDIAERMVRWVWSTRAAWAIAPIQDFLSLGTEARMNYPGRREGNWGWRLQDRQLSDALAAQVHGWNQDCGRL